MANSIVAAIASFIIPGLGQIYAGDMKRGIIFIIIAIIFYTVMHFSTGMFEIICFVVDLIFSLFAAYDAYKLAQ